MKGSAIYVWLLAALVHALPTPQSPSAPLGSPPNPNDPFGILPGTGSSPSDAGQSKTPPQQGKACAANVDVLASGLQKNLQLAGGETGATQAMVNILLQAGGPDADMARFDPEKKTLAGFVSNDIAQMSANVVALPQGNLAAAGIRRVLDAMQQASAAIDSMTGNKDRDGPVLSKLQNTWDNNMRQNMQNLLDATQGCMPSDKGAAQNIQKAELEGLKVTQPQPQDPLSGIFGLSAGGSSSGARPTGGIVPGQERPQGSPP